jgi:hypothetical protein
MKNQSQECTNSMQMTEPTRKTISKVSSFFFASGALLGAYALVRTWLLYRDLPAGVCPIDYNRPLLYVALGLLCVSILIDLFAGRKRKVDVTKT